MLDQIKLISILYLIYCLHQIPTIYNLLRPATTNRQENREAVRPRCDCEPRAAAAVMADPKRISTTRASPTNTAHLVALSLNSIDHTHSS